MPVVLMCPAVTNWLLQGGRLQEVDQDSLKFKCTLYMVPLTNFQICKKQEVIMPVATIIIVTIDL